MAANSIQLVDSEHYVLNYLKLSILYTHQKSLQPVSLRFLIFWYGTLRKFESSKEINELYKPYQRGWMGTLPKKGAPFLPNFEIYPLNFLPILKIFRISTRCFGIFQNFFFHFSWKFNIRNQIKFNFW